MVSSKPQPFYPRVNNPQRKRVWVVLTAGLDALAKREICFYRESNHGRLACSLEADSHSGSHSPGWTEENYDKYNSVSLTRQSFEPRTSCIQVHSINTTPILSVDVTAQISTIVSTLRAIYVIHVYVINCQISVQKQVFEPCSLKYVNPSPVFPVTPLTPTT